MKKYYVHGDYLLDKEDVESIRDSFDDFRIMVLAGEVEKDQALRESAYVAKEIECESAKLSCKQAEDEIEILRGLLNERKGWRGEHFVADVNRWIDKVNVVLAPKEEK